MEITEIVVPDTVTKVGNGAFGDVKTITFEGIEAPAGLKEAISENVTINIPEGAKESYQAALGEKANIVEKHLTHIKDGF